jgi:hypothetical protein
MKRGSPAELHPEDSRFSATGKESFTKLPTWNRSGGSKSLIQSNPSKIVNYDG